jgi:hypothetical protein
MKQKNLDKEKEIKELFKADKEIRLHMKKDSNFIY